MKRKIFLMALTAGMLSGTASAENGWGNLGGILNQACSAANGQIGGMDIDTGQFGEKMQWLCQLKNIHGFINDNILNGDWEGFAKDVAGQYIGQLANYAGGAMGDTSKVNAIFANLNQALNSNYSEFRKALYGSALQTFQGRQSFNEGSRPGSVGAITDQAMKANPTLALADRIAQTQDAFNAMKGVENAYKANKVQQEAKKAIETNTAQAMSNATNVIGTATKEGIVDKYVKDARTALSTREQTEILTNLTGEAMKQKATSDVAILNQLSEIAQQQVMTNTQMMLQRQQAESEAEDRRMALTASIEEMVAANQEEAEQYKAEVDAAYSGLSDFLGAKIQLTSVGE